MTADLAVLVTQCAKFPQQLKTAQKAAAKQAGDAMRITIEKNTRAIAPSGVLSNVGRTGARVGARVEVLRNGNGAIVEAIGPYQLIERDTRAHPIPRRRRKQRVLVIPGIGFRRSVSHPGTRGRHPFERAVKSATPKVTAVYQRQLVLAVAKTFGPGR